MVNKFNELASKNILELEVLKAKENLSTIESKQKAIIGRYMQINRTDRKTFTYLLVGCIAASFWLSILGAFMWFKNVQPKQDELLNLQIEKMKREIQILDKRLHENNDVVDNVQESYVST